MSSWIGVSGNHHLVPGVYGAEYTAVCGSCRVCFRVICLQGPQESNSGGASQNGYAWRKGRVLKPPACELSMTLYELLTRGCYPLGGGAVVGPRDERVASAAFFGTLPRSVPGDRTAAPPVP
jgi:hypothetical protein